MATWNTDFNNSPANGDSPGAGDDKIRETRLEIYTRMIKGHIWGGSSTADGWHREGSGVAYYQSTEPTLRPDAATALSSADSGRLWVNSDGNSLEVWDGDSFEEVQFTSSGNVLIVQDQKTQNTDGGACTGGGTYDTRVLNTTIKNSISGASLASNQITLPTGVYYAEFAGPAYLCNSHTIRLRDTTSSQTLGNSVSSYAINNASGTQTNSYGFAYFTLLSESVLELQHSTQTARAGDGFGVAANVGTEVYAQIMILEVG